MVVPVLLLTGPVGAGKSTVALEAARRLREASIPHALVDLAWMAEEVLRVAGWLGS